MTTDDVAEYPYIFPNAIAIETSNGNVQNSLILDKLNSQFGESYFVVYELATPNLNEDHWTKRPFCLVLFRNISKFNEFYYNVLGKHQEYTAYDQNKIVAYGQTKLVNENLKRLKREKKIDFSPLKDAISLAFSYGNPISSNEHVASYLYRPEKEKIVELKTFLKFNYDTEK